MWPVCQLPVRPSQPAWGRQALFYYQKWETMGYRGDGSAVKSTQCSCRRPELVPRIHNGWVTIACNSSSKGHDILFWSPRVPVFTPTYLHINTHKYAQLKIQSFFSPVEYWRNVETVFPNGGSPSMKAPHTHCLALHSQLCLLCGDLRFHETQWAMIAVFSPRAGRKQNRG